jgi:hypothetical protein
MEEPWNEPTAVAVEVCVRLTVAGRFATVNALESAVVDAAHNAGRQLYGRAFAQWQQHWLEARRDRYHAIRWRSIEQVTPLGRLRLPVRVIREKRSGRYVTLSKLLRRGKATRLLSPLLEQRATEAACEQNYRPAARSLSRWVGQHIGAWLVWGCVQFHGQRRLEELERQWPRRGSRQRVRAPVVITELDSTWLRRQQRRRRGAVRHFMVHMGVHYTGRQRRYRRAGSPSVRLAQKSLWASMMPLRLFGPALRRHRDQGYQAAPSVVLSDGDEGLERLREQHFPEAVWLLDRWHVTRAVREFVGDDAAEFRRLMEPLWRADSEGALEALRQSPWRQRRPEAFRALFGYLLGNREGIENWKRLPAEWRRSMAGAAARVKSGSGAVEKNLEVQINRRFKRQGRSWDPRRAERLLQLRLLIQNGREWIQWWQQPSRFKPRTPP